MRRGRKDSEAHGAAKVPARGIVIHRGQPPASRQPRISAFIWGGKVRPTPTLPYGRWKDNGAA